MSGGGIYTLPLRLQPPPNPNLFIDGPLTHPPLRPDAPASESEDRTASPDAPAIVPNVACELDPLSVRGLRTLFREDPNNWRDRLRDRLPPEVLAGIDAGYAAPKADLRQVLLSHSPALLPQPGSTVGVETVRRARQVLAAVIEHDGDMPAMLACDMLSVLRTNIMARLRANDRSPLSPENASRAMSLVRQALNGWRGARSEPPLPEEPPANPAPPRRPQKTTRLRVIWQILRLASPWERIKIALAVGAGLRQPEIDGLRVGDVTRYMLNPAEARGLGLLPAVELMFLWVADAHDPGRGRWVPLPPWVGQVIGAVPHGDRSDLLVAEDKAPSLTATLRRLRRTVEGGARVSPSSLRRTWQAIARRAGCSREVVRGTWRQRLGQTGWPARWHLAQVELWRLAAAGADFGAGVAERFVDGIDLVPRRARPGCGPRDPEVLPRGSSAPAPLPSRVRDLPPPAVLRGRKRGADPKTD